MSHKLWLTYAWKDNEDENFDFIVSELRNQGLIVNFDRVQLLTGKRLWEQIDSGILDSDTSAWAIYLTENSLRSEPCQEELAYALDRTLRSRGSNFPLIGLFPGPLDRAIIPSAIATRLYVDLRTNDWAQQIANGVYGVNRNTIPHLEPFGQNLQRTSSGYLLDVWPRAGHWAETYAIVPESDCQNLTALTTGPRGQSDSMWAGVCGDGHQNGVYGRVVSNIVDSVNVAKIYLSHLPEWIEFGPAKGKRFRLEFDKSSDAN